MKKVQLDPEQQVALLSALGIGLSTVVAFELALAYFKDITNDANAKDVIREGPSFLFLGKSVVDERRKLGLPDRGLTKYGR